MTDDCHMTPASGRLTTVPTELAALAAGVTVATIRKWASRGKLTRYGSPGRAEYDIDELQDLVASQATAHQTQPARPRTSSRKPRGGRSRSGGSASAGAR